MTQDTILPRLTAIFRDLFGDETITLTPETTAEDIEDWDSVSHISIIVAVEIAFGIKFQTAELESLKKVGDMVALIEGKLRQHAV